MSTNFNHDHTQEIIVMHPHSTLCMKGAGLIHAELCFLAYIISTFVFNCREIMHSMNNSSKILGF